MADYDDFDERGGFSRTRRVEAFLEYTGVPVIAVGVLWGIFMLVDYSRQDEPATWAEIFRAIAVIFGSIWAGVTLWSLAELVRRLMGLQHANEQIASSLRDSTAGYPRGGRSSLADAQDLLDELVVLTREVRDISLLNEEQRALRLQAQGQAVRELLQREVPLLLREHNWIEARNRVQEARERFPSFSEWDALEHNIEEMRAQVEQRDIESAQRQIDDLTLLGAWDRVSEVINELLERHPDSTAAIELAHNVRTQRHSAEAEQRARMMAEAQEAANRREWKSALAIAQGVIQRFPKSPEAQALRMQLPTLQENAEIQTRQQMEAEIRELVKDKRFEEALRIAHQLIEAYPDSPQAGVLREQLPRLEEKSRSSRIY